MKGKGLLRKFSTLVLFFFMLSVVGVVAPTSTLAGDGGGDQIPTLLATYLTQVSGDTSTDVHQVTETKKVVPIKPTFRLNFSNNVTDETIWADNQGCVSIEDSNSSALPVDVTRIGTGLGTDPYKSDIFVTPTNDLISGYTYTIVIDAALTAKNGQVLTQAVEVPFTAGVAV
ncbi:MAG: Ig-like domain-containing protein, partial [Chitinophagales bacterium]